MTPYYSDELATLFHGDCRDILATLPDNSVDSIVTDPPYELGFMGKSWDNTGVAYDVRVWTECLRVLKPGGHLLAFGGSRTYHRLAVAVEDAGFQIRDQIMWVYGSGFPKSLDVSKAIDKQRHGRAQIYEVTAWIRSARDSAGIGNRDIDDAFGFAGMAGHWTSSKSQPAVPTLDQIPDFLNVLGVNLDEVPDEIRDLIWTLNGHAGQPGPNWAKREVISSRTKKTKDAGMFTPGDTMGASKSVTLNITSPATDAAHQWEGWGTALKPAHEPIVLARKPLIGTVADTVLTHGTGALNIDGCRVAHTSEADRASATPQGKVTVYKVGNMPDVQNDGRKELERPDTSKGRFPANFIHDGSDEVLELFPDSKGGAFPAKRGQAVNTNFASGQETEGGFRAMGDSGSASRFFYSPKASKADRNDGLEGMPPIFAPTMKDGIGGKEHNPDTASKRANFHPTVKPTDLMRYLCRLVTPPTEPSSTRSQAQDQQAKPPS